VKDRVISCLKVSKNTSKIAPLLKEAARLLRAGSFMATVVTLAACAKGDGTTLTFSDGASYSYGPVIVNQTGSKTFTVTNGGDNDAKKITIASFGNAAFQFKGGAYPGTGGTCGPSIASAAACTVVVDFTPTATGDVTDALTFQYTSTNNDQTATISISGTGTTAAVLEFSTGTSFDFGSKAITSSTDQVITLTNTGGVRATSITTSGTATPLIYKGNAYPGVGGTCSDSLGPGATCLIVLNFLPTQATVSSMNLVFAYHNGTSQTGTTLAVTGTGASAAALAISEGPYFNYGDLPLNSSADKVLVLNNGGGIAATSVSASTLSSGFRYKGGTFPGTGGTCSTSLAGYASCLMVVTFAPTVPIQYRTTLSLTYNDGITTQTVARLLLGTGTPAWTWVAGSSSANQLTVPGTQGTPASTSAPGARSDPSGWVDASGVLWLFGGLGIDSTGSLGELNDLWKFDGSNWTWVKGVTTKGASGTYGTQGTAASANIPGARHFTTTWKDSSGVFWLFGGYGRDASGNIGYLNDLWKFNGTDWTYVFGSSARNASGTYGTLGTGTAMTTPGSRHSSVSWVDSSGNFWIYGGYGYDEDSTGAGPLSDLWKWDGSKWTWVAGSNSISQLPTHGTLGTAAGANTPGSRIKAVAWTDSSDNLYLFGGQGYDSLGIYDQLNDLWKFNGAAWTWVGGSNIFGQAGSYGNLGQSVSVNYPGARSRAITWKDSNGVVWMFGGYGYDSSGTPGPLNDLWKWDGTNWGWISGGNSCGIRSTYGTKGVASLLNVPGARIGATAWIDSHDSLWLFGGSGLDSFNFGRLNDLWKF
jgi:N-acetylneuraminic acid mutarotase